jgi:radical SAM protein with 4Fe4S-binding SPASM domain
MIRPWRNRGLLLARVALSNLGRQDLPYKLNLAATTRCNQKCSICRIWERDVQEIGLTEIESFFTNSGFFSWVDVTGGEIVLRPDIPEVFDIILRKCPDLALLHFPTNGYLTEETVYLAREILGLGSPGLVITVSIDGPPDLHNRMRGSEDAYDRAMETFSRLRELKGCQTFLGFTVAPYNFGRFEETLSAIMRAHPKISPLDLHVNLMQQSEHYYGNQDLDGPDPVKMAREVSTILHCRPSSLKPLHLLQRRYLTLAQGYLRTGRSPMPCQALSASCFLSPDGQIYPCVGYDASLGSIRDCGYNLSRLWDQPHAVSIRETIRGGHCPGCWSPCDAFPTLAGNLLTANSQIHEGAA